MKLGRRSLGKKSIKNLVAEMRAGQIKLFPRRIYTRPESIRARCGEFMKANPSSRLVTANEEEGTYICRLR